MMILSWWWHSVVAQISSATLVIIALCVAAWFFPLFRKWLLGAAGLVAAFLFAYARGARDQARGAAAKNEANVKKAEEKYDEIDNRPDPGDGGVGRMRDGKF